MGWVQLLSVLEPHHHENFETPVNLVAFKLHKPPLSTMGVTTKHTLQFKVCIILIFITLAGYYLLRYREEEVIQAITQLQHGEKETFIKISIQTANEVAFDIQPIRELCGNITWTDGLIFQCDAPQGGVGNVENFFVNCVRYAIEAGGIISTIP